MKIAVIAAHPDDEALGCGGTLLKYRDMGAEIYLLFMTNGIGAREGITPQDYLERRQGIMRAMDLLAPKDYKLLDFPDNQLDTIPLLNIVREIETFINQKQPNAILTHFINDLNIDHVITSRAVMTASRPGTKSFTEQILSFEVPSSTEWAVGNHFFHPDCYVDISAYMDEKISYLKCYEREMCSYPHPRSFDNMRALNQVRGSQLALPYAEAFITLRRIIKNVF